MSRLILHADDFGLHPSINQAILAAAGKGTLTSSSLMANGPAAGEALSEAAEHPELGIGLHLNIVRGTPLSAANKIPSLVDDNGLFFNSMGALLRRSLLGRISPEHVYQEYRQQLIFMLDHGYRPTHFDSEKHSHILLPEAVLALKRLQKEFSVDRVRIINESPLVNKLSAMQIPVRVLLRQRLKLLFLQCKVKQARPHWKKMKSTDYTFGLLQSGQATNTLAILEQFEALLAMPDGLVIEWMFHPGYSPEMSSLAFRREYGAFFLNTTRLAEADFLLCEQTADLAATHKNRLISYREL